MRMPSDTIANVSMVVLTICAVAVTALVVRAELAPHVAPDRTMVVQRIRDWRSYGRGHRLGGAAAPVTIVEFSDFQCPFCRTMADRLRAVRERHAADVAVVYRHLPLPGHPHALAAARASECAARQGHFEGVHDALFARQDSIGRLPWRVIAATGGVPDLGAFDRCMADSLAPIASVAADTQAAHALGIRGTPHVLVNGLHLRGAVPDDTLEKYVAEALRAHR
jgi:protein-disulfide isomerase